MCGIAGLINCGDDATLSRMIQVQAHRGPDDAGTWTRGFPDGGYVGLGNRRLAILDLSPGGHMPMSNEDGSIWITYNGEIYNFRELRRELLAKGHRFRSRTDTEVITHLYEEEGPDCVKRLNGMFAFAICDLRGPTPAVFMARDHFGIKPFYYTQQGERFAFASEIKALLQVQGVQAEVDYASLQRYLALLWVPDPDTIFRGVLKLPAGHWAIFSDGELKVSQYWDLQFPPREAEYPASEADLIEGIRQHFRRAVETQMVSDVPLGAFLSAGIDSSSIVATMSKLSNQPTRTYTVTFPSKYRMGERTLDNPRVAENFAKRLGCDHQTIVVEPDVVALLPKLTWHMDEPTADPAIIPAYLVCHEAGRNTTVLLSGVGGDELFAGYRKYSAHYWSELYGRIPSALRRGIVEPVLLNLPPLRGTPVKGFLRLAKKMARSGSLSAVERFLMNCTYLDENKQTNLLSAAVSAEINGADPFKAHRKCFGQVGHADFLNQMLYLDTKIFMTSLNLTYADKMSMASSVEVRVPFLDRELAEFVAWNVPPQLKLRSGVRPVTKHIFRKAVADLLPAEVLQQPKAGFGAPVDYWLANELRPMVDDLLSDERLRKRGIFQPSAVRALIRQHRNGAQDWSMQIWQLLTFEIWMENFLDNDPNNVEVHPAVMHSTVAPHGTVTAN